MHQAATRPSFGGSAAQRVCDGVDKTAVIVDVFGHSLAGAQ
jgi:hypothetical protein